MDSISIWRGAAGNGAAAGAEAGFLLAGLRFGAAAFFAAGLRALATALRAGRADLRADFFALFAFERDAARFALPGLFFFMRLRAADFFALPARRADFFAFFLVAIQHPLGQMDDSRESLEVRCR